MKIDIEVVKHKLLDILRIWVLPVAMVAGVLGYVVCSALPFPPAVHQVGYVLVSRYVQPVLLFTMLFLSFSKVDPRDLRPKRWHLRLLVCQLCCMTVCAVLAWMVRLGVWPFAGCGHGALVLCEGAMLCFVCPTATASAVVTGRLGGSVSGVTSYLLVCNLMVALVAPLLLTMVEPRTGLDFLTSMFMIMGKVFPLLVCPLIAAWVVKFLLPRLHKRIRQRTGLAFRIWAVSLTLAIAVSVRAIVTSRVSVWLLVGLALVSLVCCVFQFGLGKMVGGGFDIAPSHRHRITAGQALGQKNTVFIIWLGLVFLDPVTSIVGGLYSVWHNLINSYQLNKARQ